MKLTVIRNLNRAQQRDTSTKSERANLAQQDATWGHVACLDEVARVKRCQLTVRECNHNPGIAMLDINVAFNFTSQ